MLSKTRRFTIQRSRYRIKQILIIGLALWFILCIIYYLIYLLNANNNNNKPTKPRLLSTLKSKYNYNNDMIIDNNDNNNKYGHPSKKDMENPCIVILTYNRPNELKQTIDSLLSIEGVKSYQIYISQDGNQIKTTKMIENEIGAIPYKEKSDKWIIKHIHHEQLRNIHEATQKLAIHYKYMFNIIFNEMNHSHGIILEDDMIFSKDFLEYFASTVYLLNDDKNKLFCISSWNDYGQNFLNHNEKLLYRTDYFPGLGWLLKKSLWTEIENLFPNDHWDHFMRIDTITKNRDCIYPDLSRNYNIGKIGSTMDMNWYNKYLLPIQFIKESHINFRNLDLSYLEYNKYENYIIDIFENKSKFVGIFPKDSNKIFKLLDNNNNNDNNEYGNNYLLIAYYGWNWKSIANKIGVLETQRTKHKNTIFIKKNDITYIFANIRLSPYLKYNKELNDILLTMNIKNENMEIITGKTGESCFNACKNHGLTCLDDHFEYVNKCSILKQYFKCESGCLGGQLGEDVPNYVNVNKPGLYQKCLTTDEPPTCHAKHYTTNRICPCA